MIPQGWADFNQTFNYLNSIGWTFKKKSEKLHLQVTFRFPYVSHLRPFNESYKDTEAITVSHAECSRARYFSLCEIA